MTSWKMINEKYRKRKKSFQNQRVLYSLIIIDNEHKIRKNIYNDMALLHHKEDQLGSVPMISEKKKIIKIYRIIWWILKYYWILLTVS